MSVAQYYLLTCYHKGEVETPFLMSTPKANLPVLLDFMKKAEYDCNSMELELINVIGPTTDTDHGIYAVGFYRENGEYDHGYYGTAAAAGQYMVEDAPQLGHTVHRMEEIQIY